MNIPRRTLTENDIRNATYRSNTYTARAVREANDVLREDRRAASCCRSCYYSSRIGGAAITSTECALCGKAMHFGSTAVDTLCLACGVEHALCVRCGGDTEGREKRRKFPEAKRVEAPKP